MLTILLEEWRLYIAQNKIMVAVTADLWKGFYCILTVF